jgi:ATP-dependent DNA helicase DinG
LDAARDMYGASLSLAVLFRLVKDIRNFTFAPGQPTADIIRECDRVHSKSRLLFQFLNKEIPEDSDGDTERFATKIRERTVKLMAALKENIDALAAMLKSRPAAVKFEVRRRDALRVLDRVHESLAAFSHHQDLVCWMESGEGWTVEKNWLTLLCSIPKNLGERLHQDFWNRNIPIILTSGTLSAAGSFEHLKKKIGLNLVPEKRLCETAKPSPFDYRENALLYISENTPFPENGNAAYIASIAGEIEQLVHASRGHAAVLFTSYKVMDMVWERIVERKLPYPLFRLDRGGVMMIERFKNSGDGILFASGALWEGIDIPGDILSMLIIVRLPFAVPDPVSDWEKTLYADFNKYKAMVITPEMLVKSKQGAGRLLRTETDTGVIAFLDSRANTRGAYRDRLLAALPPCRDTSSVRDVEQFKLQKKQPAYFAQRALPSK